MVRVARVVIAILLGAASLATRADEPPRPRMEQLEHAPADDRPPPRRELNAARRAVERRFREALAHADSAAGANAATAALLDAAVAEEDRAVKWVLLAEARRLAAAAGNAAGVDRSFVLAAADYEFDALAEEQRMLREIPLQALDPPRATALAEVAEGLAQRAEADGRRDVAADSLALAIRGWQRAGNRDAARRAAARLGEVEKRARPAPR